MDTPYFTKERFPHGVRCSCKCSCEVPLNEGNGMKQKLDSNTPYWDRSESSTGILICVNCFVGIHKEGVPA